MENNLAHDMEQRNYRYDYQDFLYLEEIEGQKGIPKRVSKVEFVLLSFFGSIIFVLLLLQVQSNIQLAESSRRVQDLKVEIESANLQVDNLSQHAQELSQYDRLFDVAEKYGLELHSDNIRNLNLNE